MMMMIFAVSTLLLLVTSSSAFVPSSHIARVSVVLEAEKGTKRKLALKTVRRVAGAVGTIAVATSVIPGAAHAKTAAKVADAVPFVSAPAAKEIATFTAGAVVALIGKSVLGGGSSAYDATAAKISSVFPGSQKNKALVSNVKKSLKPYGYGKKSLVATSLCADEVNRVLESDFKAVYDENFSMGGLSGFPFGGVTSFGAMAAHIPDGGSCLVVFGPHVGVDSNGDVGTVERRGRANGGSCCGSAVAASGYVQSVASGASTAAGPPESPLDAQQTYVGNLLLPYAKRLSNANDRMVELPYALYDAQKKMISEIVAAGAGNVAGEGKIAVLGGIQINTPQGKSDYFKPLSFELYDNKGKLQEDLIAEL